MDKELAQELAESWDEYCHQHYLDPTTDHAKDIHWYFSCGFRRAWYQAAVAEGKRVAQRKDSK